MKARPLWVVTGAVVVLAVVAGVVVSWRSGYPYVGTTRRVNLTWSCWNQILWTDTESHVDWYAGHDPVPRGKLDTAPSIAGEPPTRHASGRLHFDSRTRATFTSDAGGTLELRRQPKGAFYTADCRISPP